MRLKTVKTTVDKLQPGDVVVDAIGRCRTVASAPQRCGVHGYWRAEVKDYEQAVNCHVSTVLYIVAR